MATSNERKVRTTDEPRLPALRMSNGAKTVEKEKILAQLKGKLWYCIERQVNEETPFDTTCTPTFINALVELCYMQLIEMGKDLEAFARHAGRETITVDDLMLLLRKTPSLQKALRAHCST